ncbi:LytR/AlgR family response regulator transcription factor [Pedobacter sp. MW01-1-1]|uniref:LytR/AlgR family response regulator transcription factor n=1 Tax=Pedobacter sp. MW01-1-1 TaxID=3383027 RepID=UPI003FEF1853
MFVRIKQTTNKYFMILNCIAIDDEVSGLEVLSDYLSSSPNFNLCQSFSDPLLALNTIQKSKGFDVIFMDIEMPKMSGIELSKMTRHKTRKLIFTTAHPQYAIDAFDIEADAFLLKPFSLAKLNYTLSKLFETSNSTNDFKSFKTEEYFYIKSKNEKFKLVKIKYDEIIAVESMQNYVSIYTTQKTIVASLNLTRVKELLQNQHSIIQIHRSFLISKKYIEEIENNIVRMKGGLKITIGENYKEVLLSYVRTRTIKTGRN